MGSFDRGHNSHLRLIVICNLNGELEEASNEGAILVTGHSEQIAIIAARICELPLKLGPGEGGWIGHLVGGCGIIESPDVLTSGAIAEHLRNHPHLIEAWMEYSGSKRYSPSWYLIDCADESFEVGFCPGGPRFTFTDGVRACTEFIARDITQLVELLRGKGVPPDRG